MSGSLIVCDYCGKQSEKQTGAVNRAKRAGLKIYCNRVCSGFGRRLNKTDKQKKLEKREYDQKYREQNKALLKNKKSEYFKRTYDPKQARIERKKRSAVHAEYCRTPEYRKWKKVYDRTYRAKKLYGEYWESFLLTQDIRSQCLSFATAYEIRLSNNGYGKSTRRKRNANIKRH